MLLFAACVMFTSCTASAGEISIASPVPVPIEHEALASNLEEVELVVYDITLAEMLPVVRERGFKGNVVDAAKGIVGLIRQTANASPPLSDADRNAIRSLTRLENENDNEFIVFTGSNDATRIFIKELENRNKMSILTRPRVACTIGTPAHIMVGDGTQKYEMKLLPVHHEDGKLVTKVVVERTEILDGKEKTHQWELSVNLPTDNRTSLIMGGKLGDKEVILFVTAQQYQQAVPEEILEKLGNL